LVRLILLDVGQSTASEHLKILAGVGFVLAERRGAAAYYRVNGACVRCFPSAADIVMGRPVPAARPAGPRDRRYPVPGDTGQARALVLARYGQLAQAAAGGAQVTDCDPGAPGGAR
jgi:DNA-binding transcriptional ArsR family regulator